MNNDLTITLPESCTSFDVEDAVRLVSDTPRSRRVTLSAELEEFIRYSNSCYGIRARCTETPTKYLLNRFTHFGLCEKFDLVYSISEYNVQQSIREYLDKTYSFKPGSKIQILISSDLMYISDLINHMKNEIDGSSWLWKKYRRRLKYIAREMSKYPDLKIYYWESDRYENF